MDLYDLNSSLVHRVGYDVENEILRLKLATNDMEYYDYTETPIRLYAGLVEADHPGSYYNRYIKGRFSLMKSPILLEAPPPALNQLTQNRNNAVGATPNPQTIDYKRLANTIISELFLELKSCISSL